jgi:hypothetical protein
VHFITDESDNHAVKIEEEHDQMKTELAERFLVYVSSVVFLPSDSTYLLVNIQFPENLGRI